MKRLGIILLLIPLSFCIYAQESSPLIRPLKLNTDYIKDYKRQLTTRAYLLSESVGFRIKPSTQAQDIYYVPNSDIKNGLAVFYKWFGIGLSIDNPFSGQDVTKKGESKIIDLRLNAYGSAFSAEIALQDYHGFYLSNMKHMPVEWNSEDPYLQRPDMEILSASALFYLVFNYKKHSFRSAFIHNERQLKSSGSLVLMPSFVYLDLRADSCLIPDFYLNKWEVLPNETIREGKFLTAGISLGYSYTFVFLKYFFLNLALIPGGYLQYYDYEAVEGRKIGRMPSLLWLGRSAFGFNSDHFYFGIGGIYGYNTSPLNIGETNFNYDMNQIRLWIGTRFNIKKKNRNK